MKQHRRKTFLACVFSVSLSYAAGGGQAYNLAMTYLSVVNFVVKVFEHKEDNS